MQNLTASRKGFKFDLDNSEALAFDSRDTKRVIRFEVSYLKSLSGRKGVLVSVGPREIEQRDGHTTEIFVVFSGYSVFVKELARKNDKEVAKVAEALDGIAPAICEVFKTLGKDASKAALIQQASAILNPTGN